MYYAVMAFLMNEKKKYKRMKGIEMEKVRAKFKCNTVLNAEHYTEVNLSPVYDTEGEDHENRKFWEATPAGELKMQISNLPASEMFVPGAEYYLDFTPAS